MASLRRRPSLFALGGGRSLSARNEERNGPRRPEDRCRHLSACLNGRPCSCDGNVRMMTRIYKSTQGERLMSEAHQALISQVSAAVQAYQRSTDAFDDLVARELKVNRSDLRCLDYLFGGPMTTSELARATALSLSATTTLVDRLQRRGFVTRVADVTDRRKVMVEMTDDGRRQAGTFYASLAQGGRTFSMP